MILYPFGLTMPGRSKGEALTREQFTGQLRDNEPGFNLDYFKARYYDPAMGRFLSVDPLADKMPSWTPYHYTFNNPLVFTDPDGRMPIGSLSPIRINLFPGATFEKSKIAFAAGNPAKAAILFLGAVFNEASGDPDPFTIDPNPISGGTKAGIKFGASMLKGLAKFGDDAILFAKLPKSGAIDPNNILFSQGSISGTFREGGKISDLVRGLKDGTIDPSSVPAIRIVELDGKTFTLDNRRLNAFQEAGVPIRFEKLDEIPQDQLFKFRDYFEGKTDGTTVRIRGQ